MFRDFVQGGRQTRLQRFRHHLWMLPKLWYKAWTVHHDNSIRECCRYRVYKKKQSNVLHHTVKSIDPRLKSQARAGNNRSRALKWDIVHLCSSITFWATTNFIEIWGFKIWFFEKFQKCLKCKNSRKLHILLLIISIRLFKLERCTTLKFLTYSFDGSRFNL